MICFTCLIAYQPPVDYSMPKFHTNNFYTVVVFQVYLSYPNNLYTVILVQVTVSI